VAENSGTDWDAELRALTGLKTGTSIAPDRSGSYALQAQPQRLAADGRWR
jgi:hypothetical protein